MLFFRCKKIAKVLKGQVFISFRKRCFILVDIPVPNVLHLRSQGYSNAQIVDYLRREGFPQNLINEAMMQADAKSAVDGSYNQQNSQVQSMQMPQMNQAQNFSDNSSSTASDESQDETEEIEALIEEIIEEKWKELVKDIKKMAEWKDKTDERMSKIEQSFIDLKSNFDNLHKALIGKIGEYDKNILDVGTDIKAMEKVFEKVLPRFTENVNELSRIAKTMRFGSDEESKK